MSREYVYLIAGILLGMLPFCGYFAYKKIGIFDIRPDRIVTYKEVDGVKLSLHVFDAKTKKDASTLRLCCCFMVEPGNLAVRKAFTNNATTFHGLV